MPVLAQQSSATSLMQQSTPSMLPTLALQAARVTGGLTAIKPVPHLYGFVFQNAAPAASSFDLIPAVVGSFWFAKLIYIRVSVATEIRLRIGATTFLDFDPTAGQYLQFDFGDFGLFSDAANVSLNITNPFAVTDIRAGVWYSYA